ncbi:esterase-like activity of phytase family protein [Amycolatopsis benzoatilytica]|uniref:esterase-like activity of phytase family protein n=1 Tax=Amycolatopsis benzoatilytica TaxID=346045 RepID=UPI00036A96C1|nr:esterase-like activity of phytase family protein [Amycolatopsis benzoatilytica]
MFAHQRGKIRVTVALSVVALAFGAGAAHAAPKSTAWPGGSKVAVADGSGVFGKNLSGLSFESPQVLWAIDNGPSKLYRLVPDGAKWRPDTANGWGKGKSLHYPGGSGDPDTEGVVSTPDGVFASTERDNDNGDTSKPGILRFDTSGSGKSINATAEWDLTADLPSVDPNKGFEAIAWVPDSALTARKFRDERTKAVYDPAKYPNHGTGLYFAGLEANGKIYAYALDQSGKKYTRVATIDSGFSTIMDLEYEASTGHLWAECDNNCKGHTTTLDINANGTFAVSAEYDRPSGMSNYNNEGFAISPNCVNGSKQVVWSDDDNDDNHALRTGTLNCK